ncbi:MAG: hypothetical protein CVU35_00820 [Betaproteobacteria bacterium HGW-Betaproteobacteria-8]|nr:MAG: hypothetical protein CVU35_00820 [Betaproteobacteria bacterium HGW-Betaproteobacteria-8]
MALSRLLRPLHIGVSTMSCVVEQKFRSTEVQVNEAAEGRSILDVALGNQNRDSVNVRTYAHMQTARREKEMASRQACDASGNLYHKFYYQGL